MGFSRLTCALPAWLCFAACAQAPEQSRAVAVTIAALRPDDPQARAEPPAYAASDRLEHFDSRGGFFRVHFTRAGVHAVPLDDADTSGTPDYVEHVASEYEAVLAFFRDELGFAEPLHDGDLANNGGDDRFDVYLVDFPNSSDGAYRREACAGTPRRCSGYMLQENDFDGRGYASLEIATRVLASHELFHAVQNAYDADAGVVLGEGTAVWASEAYDAQLEDFESFIGGYFAHPERSLGQEPIGPVDAFSYGSAIFFRYIEERYDRRLIRELWEARGEASESDGGEPSAWTHTLDAVLARRHGKSLSAEFGEFARWNLFTGARADAREAYARGADYPAVTERTVDTPYRDEQLRVFPLSVRYFAARARASGDARLELTFSAGEPRDGIVLVLARESNSSIVDVASADAARSARVTLEGIAEGDRIHAAVINARLDGESSRPAVCFGGPGDTRPCAGADSTERDHDTQPETPRAADSGGCSIAASGCARHGFPWITVPALAIARGARRRRSGRA